VIMKNRSRNSAVLVGTKPGTARHKRAWPTLLVLAAAIAGTLTVGASSALAANPFTDFTTNFTRVESPNPQLKGRWSERLATVPDLDGDGVNELLVADPSESFSGFPNAGRVYMQDGDTRKFMYQIDSPEIQAGAKFGFFISVIGDVNGDGKADFAVGTDAQNVDAKTGLSCTPGTTNCNKRQGKAWVFSGATGQMLYSLTDPDPQAQARFGSRIGRAGDVNNDGIPDIIVGASGSDDPAGCGHNADGTTITPLPGNCRVGEGAAYIFSGKDGTLIRRLTMPAADKAPAPCAGSCGSFGLAVQGFGDVTSPDGVSRLLVDAATFNYDTSTKQACKLNPMGTFTATCNKSQGAEYVFDGKTGAEIRRTDDPAPQATALFGFQDVEPLAPGDVNGDGIPDYYANGFLQDGPTGLSSAGRAFVFSGKDGSLLYEIKDPRPVAGGQFAFSMVKTDYNKDGTPDLYVGKTPHQEGGTGTVFDQRGGTDIFNGKDGSLLKSLDLPASDAQPGAPGNDGSNLGFTVAAPGDLNGDGEPDYVAGAPFEDVGTGLPFNCQAPTAGCIQDVGREYFFLSNVPPTSPPPVKSPGPPSAATGAASKLGNHSATLGGMVLTGGQSTSWFFQYGTSRSYGSATGIGRVSTDGGVSAGVSNLSSATTYHFRLVAINSSGTSYGADRTFRTTGSRFNGRLILKGSRMRVKGGKVSVRFQCASTKACIGKFSIGTRAKIAKTHKTATILCTKGSTSFFRIAAHRTKTVTGAVPGSCVSLIRAARGHQITAKLTSKPRTPQAAVIRIVKLFLG